MSGKGIILLAAPVQMVVGGYEAVGSGKHGCSRGYSCLSLRGKYFEISGPVI